VVWDKKAFSKVNKGTSSSIVGETNDNSSKILEGDKS